MQQLQEKVIQENQIPLNVFDPQELHSNPIHSTNSNNPTIVSTVSFSSDGQLECLLCQNYFSSIEPTTLHLVSHGIGTIIACCRVCGQTGELSQLFNQQENQIVCLQCQYLTGNKQKKNEIAKPKVSFTCEICGKSFQAKGHLTRHRLIHSGAKPFLCHVCGTGFNQKVALQTHVLTHAGMNPFKCNQCGQTFRFKVSLHSHMVSVHGNVKDVSPRSRGHACDRCGKLFATSYKLRRHYRSHTGEQPFECTRCNRLFSQSSNLKLHQKRHEQEDNSANAAAVAAGCFDNLVNSTFDTPEFDVHLLTESGQPTVTAQTHPSSDNHYTDGPQHPNSDAHYPDGAQTADPHYPDASQSHQSTAIHYPDEGEDVLDRILQEHQANMPDSSVNHHHHHHHHSLMLPGSAAHEYNPVTHITPAEYELLAPAPPEKEKLFSPFSLFIDDDDGANALPTFSSLHNVHSTINIS